ncbi:MAG TPA: FMN-binding negative transcriptional regulator [Arenimonas sp.]|nr:FMN-binding negative transcriptional regulator [Arenimonas sp.]HOZ04206.1 FMN-binding negative transcriptional regulator [Arenimonas sp.]HPO24050.1 FMN-binding negative transcriptional regulator [Arenimonas sp.]HPW31312.1 FMN-binding negative transcriptional regulator [Arenimonas sp.]
MYTPKYFAETDLLELDRLVEWNAFASVITTVDGQPFVSHIPVLYERNESEVIFRGHWAKPNPQWKGNLEALLIIHGPNAYISPGWYPDKEEKARVPTWNYAIAHIHGQLEVTHEEKDLASIVSDLTEVNETMVGSDWEFEPETREDHRKQLAGIVGFRLVAKEISMKFKLSQNHPEANIESVIEQLPSSNQHHGALIAEMMREQLDKQKP